MKLFEPHCAAHKQSMPECVDCYIAADRSCYTYPRSTNQMKLFEPHCAAHKQSMPECVDCYVEREEHAERHAQARLDLLRLRAENSELDWIET